MLSFWIAHWYVIVGAIVVLFLAVKLAKALFKWVLILAVAAGLVYFGASYRDEVKRFEHGSGAKLAAEAKERALKSVRDEIGDARYVMNRDGSFTLATKSVRLQGKPGAKEAQLTFMDHTFKVELDDSWNALIEEAKKRMAASNDR